MGAPESSLARRGFGRLLRGMRIAAKTCRGSQTCYARFTAEQVISPCRRVIGEASVLEILLVIGLCKKIGSVVEGKGHRSGWYKFFIVVGWFGGEFAGGFAGGVACAILDNGREHFWLVYVAALACACLSVCFIFWLASMLPDMRQATLAPEFAAPEFAPPASSANQMDDGDNPYRAPNFSGPR